MTLDAALTAAQRAVLRRLAARDAGERAAGVREPGNLKAVSPAVGALLYVLAVQRGAKVIAELGTSHGYSTVHLAAAAERTGGHVYTVDVLPEKTAAARANLEEAGLLDRVTLRTGDGAALVEALPHGVDLALVDYTPLAFLPACEPLVARLAQGGLIFIDGGPDGQWESDALTPLRERLYADERLVVTLLPMQKQHVLAVRLSPLMP